MPLTQIKKRLEEESKSLAKALEDDAQKERDRILGEAKEKADDINRKSEQETQRLLGALKLEQSASTELAAREIELIAREEAMRHEIAEIKIEIAKKIKSDKKLYKKLFSSAIKSASQIAPISEFSIITGKGDTELIGKTAAKIKYQNLDGGLIIESLDGSVRIDASLGSIVESHDDEIKSMLLSAMFKSNAAGLKEGKKVKQKPAGKERKRTARPKSKKGK